MDNQGPKFGGAAALGAAESNAASASLEQHEDNLDGVREAETTDVADINYTGEGREEDSDKKTGIFSGKKGPIATIIGIFLAVAGIVGGSQLMQPFSLAEQLRVAFNSMQTSVSVRSNVLFKYQLGRDVNNPVKSKLFSGNVFKVSDKQAAKLKKSGIELEDIGDGKTAMKMTDADGNVKYIAADQKDFDLIRSRFGNDINLSDFNTAFKSDAQFFNAYKSGSLTWRGSIANWFESMTTKFLADNKLTRNLFYDFRSKVADADGNVKAATVDLIARGTGDVNAGGAKIASGTETGENGEIKANLEEGSGGGSINLRGQSIEGVESQLKGYMDTAVKSSGDSGGGISGLAQTGSSVICGIADVLGVGTLVVTGAEALQMIHLVTSYLEAIDKVKAGAGDDTPINELVNSLNTKKTNTHYDLNAGGASTITSSADNEASWNTMTSNATQMTNSGLVETSTNKSAMESSGITALYSGGKVNPNDSSVASFNFSGSIKRIVGGLGVSMGAFATCASVKMAANVAGVVEGIAEWGVCIAGLIGAIFTLGGTSVACAGALGAVISNVAFATVITTAISAVVSAVVPLMARLMTRDLITELAGEDLGNAIVSGANMYMGNNHRYNGGSLANLSSYTQFALAQQDVIAEDARYERATRDPMDASSQYTFMGTLLRQLMGFVGTNSIMSAVTSTNSVVMSSIAAASPVARAVDAADKLVDNYDEVCPYLASIGAVGDAYCNPYAITDMSTIDMDPGEVMETIKDDLIFENETGTNEGCSSEYDDYEQCKSANISTSGGVRIKGNSQLAKYILFCDQRESAFGIMDQNISNEIANFMDVRAKGNLSKINTVANGAIGGVPVLGDLVDVVQNGQKLANLGYINGSSCVAGNDFEEGESIKVFDADEIKGEYGKAAVNIKGLKDLKGYDDGTVKIATPSWNDKARYYQRFIEDQSLMETMGIIDKSAVTAFVEEYRESHPLDNSYEGILARYSGVTKDNVIAFMDALDYYTYLANYDPSTRYAFGQDGLEDATELQFDNDQKVAYVVLLNTIEFADVRNRNFVV